MNNSIEFNMPTIDSSIIDKAIKNGSNIDFNSMINDYLDSNREELKERLYGNPGKQEISHIYDLIARFGSDITLQQIYDNFRAIYKYVCPKCNGRGLVTEKYNPYPSGLLDSGFVENWEYRDVDCDLCKGIGYTKVKYKPKMVQDGWEKIEE